MAEDRKSYAFWAPKLEPKERAERAIKAQRVICDLPSECYRRDRDIYNIRLYENNPVITLYSFAGKFYSESPSLAMLPPEISVNNKAKSAIDTMASQIFSTDQRPRFRTVDGNSRQRRRARELQNFADGLKQELKLHRLRKRAGLDAAILESGVGAIQLFRDNGRVGAERALATEFSVSPKDGMIDGQCRTLYRQRPVARDKVIVDFSPSDEKDPVYRAIREAPQLSSGDVDDDLLIYEAWHLPTNKDSDDGWHAIALDYEGGIPLLVEPFKRRRHDVVFFALEGKFTTVWGNSMMSQVRELQQRINMNDYRKTKAFKLFHAGHLYVNREAKIKKSMLSNEIGSVWEGNGDVAPQAIQFQAVTAQYQAEIKADGDLIFANLGINIGASDGSTQLGANAPAEALREETAKGDKRNSVRQQNWEDFDIDCIKVALDIVRDIVTHNDDGEERKTKVGYKVATPGRRGLSLSDWKDVGLDEEDYILDVKPASPVPTDPAGLVAHGKEMVDMGVWTPKQFEGYLQDLDPDGRSNRQLSQERLLEKTFEQLLYDKKAAAAPDEFTNLGLALELGPEFLAQGQEDGVADKHLERLRRYLKKCKAMMPPLPVAPPGPPVQAAA